MKAIRSIILFAAMLFSLPALADTVNINAVDADTLQQSLTGIGKVRAEAIIEYREAHGPFKYVDDLMNVDGIGRTTLEANRENISLN